MVAVRATVAGAQVPVLVDGDGLFALAWDHDGAAPLLRGRNDPTLLTPHDGEYGLLAGHGPGADRLDATRHLAADLGAVILLKGPSTVVADPDGTVLVAAAGDERLATAGTGDVLAGVIGALLRERRAARCGRPWQVRGSTAKRRASAHPSASSRAT